MALPQPTQVPLAGRRVWLLAAQTLLALALGGVLFYLAFSDFSFSGFVALLPGLKAGWVAASLGALFAAHALRAWRWQGLLAAEGHRLPWWDVFASLMTGYVVNYGIPRLGEVARCSVLAARYRLPLAGVIGTVVAERAVDLLWLVGVVVLAALTQAPALAGLWQQAQWQAPGTGAWVTLALVAAAVVAVVWAGRRYAWGRAIRGFIALLVTTVGHTLRHQQRLRFHGSSLGIWLGYYLAGYAALQAFGPTQGLGLGFAFYLLALGSVGMALPLPGGLGSFHVAVIYCFAFFNHSHQTGESFGLLMHTVQFGATVLSGALLYVYLVLSKPHKEVQVTQG